MTGLYALERCEAGLGTDAYRYSLLCKLLDSQCIDQCQNPDNLRDQELPRPYGTGTLPSFYIYDINHPQFTRLYLKRM